jgi:hypothetical protein
LLIGLWIALHTREVAGSKPAAPILRSPCICGGFVVFGLRLSGLVRAVVGSFSAHWYPITALDERLETLLVALVAAHRMGVDAQREAGIRVPELGHHVRRVLAADVEDRGERVPEVVAVTPAAVVGWRTRGSSTS